MVSVCSLCAFKSNTRLLLIEHQFSSHSIEPSFRLTCGIRGCNHLFKFGSTFSSFKSHASRKHTNWQESVAAEQSNGEHDNSTLLPEASGVTVTTGRLEQEDFDYLHQNESFPDAVEEECRMSSQRIAAMFFLTFKEKFVIPQTAMNFAVGSITRLIECARKEETGDGVDPFKLLQTEYMQSKFYREEFGLVVSINLTLNILVMFVIFSCKYQRCGFKRRLVEKEDTFQYVSLIKNLKWLLQNKHICNEVRMLLSSD